MDRSCSRRRGGGFIHLSASLLASHGAIIRNLAPRNFSFNSPYGACGTCDGLGTRFEVDPELIVPNADLTIEEGAIAPFATGASRWYGRLCVPPGKNLTFRLTSPGQTYRQATQADSLRKFTKSNIHRPLRTDMVAAEATPRTGKALSQLSNVATPT